MRDENSKREWHIIGKTVRGASHERTELPNQDAIGWELKSEKGTPLILAVSDGHGSTRSFRSHHGAQFAVQTAKEVLNEFLGSLPKLSDLSAIKRVAEEQLPQQLVRKWKDEADVHLQQHPFSPAETEVLRTKHHFLAYGATLLTVLVTDSFILYLQLGDGDILTVSETGEVSRPLPSDDRLFANVTTSLCSDNAWGDFRCRFQVRDPQLSEQTPALILLATDGYADSFRDDAGFLKVGEDIWGLICSDGLDAVESSLPMWLTEASQVGSGDDITLGLVCRVSAIPESVACEYNEC
jgi:serine/threonine protein phosphatase PrpC